MRGGLLYSFSENFKFINSIFQKQRGKLLLRNFPLNFWDFFYSPICLDMLFYLCHFFCDIENMVTNSLKVCKEFSINNTCFFGTSTIFHTG